MTKAKSKKIRAGLRKIAAGETRGLKIKKLAGTQAYRLRIGGYRAIYEFINNRLTILVLRAEPRGGIYK